MTQVVVTPRNKDPATATHRSSIIRPVIRIAIPMSPKPVKARSITIFRGESMGSFLPRSFDRLCRDIFRWVSFIASGSVPFYLFRRSRLMSPVPNGPRRKTARITQRMGTVTRMTSAASPRMEKSPFISFPFCLPTWRYAYSPLRASSSSVCSRCREREVRPRWPGSYASRPSPPRTPASERQHRRASACPWTSSLPCSRS